MIDAGALYAAELVQGVDREEKAGRILERLRIYAANPELRVDPDILAAELVSNDRNLGLSYLMRSQRMLHGDLEENVAVYLSICSVRSPPETLPSWEGHSPTAGSIHSPSSSQPQKAYAATSPAG